MEDGIIRIQDGIEIMKFEDGTWILYGKENIEPFALNGSASRALELALQYGVQEGLEQYLQEVRNKFTAIQVLREAEEDYYYTLDVCKTRGFVNIDYIKD